MKKIILLVGIVACVFTACKEKSIYTLTGTFTDNGQDGKMMYLRQSSPDFSIGDIIDSAKVEKGTFTFSGIAKDTADIQLITMDDESFYPVIFFAEKGKIELSLDSTMKATLKGTAMNDKYQQFENAKGSVVEKINAADSKFDSIKEAGNVTPEQFQEYDKSSKQLLDELGKINYDFIKPVITTPSGQFIFAQSIWDLSDNQTKELISLASADFRSLEPIQNLEKKIENREATAAGKMFTDVKGSDLNGKEVSLSDYAGKGKVILVDFWASWCGPCVRSIPGLIDIYKKYKDKGFEIVGISLDSKKEDWAKAVKNLNITWPQFSNLKGWKEDCAVTYGVDAIPHTVLIDKDGKIIEHNLMEDALSFKLEELLGNK